MSRYRPAQVKAAHTVIGRHNATLQAAADGPLRAALDDPSFQRLHDALLAAQAAYADDPAMTAHLGAILTGMTGLRASLDAPTD